MKKDMIFGFMLMLSDHQWEDELSPSKGWHLPPNYNANISVEIDAWDKTVAFLAERKYNLVLIDVGDGIKYESHPEISAPNAWDKDFLRQKLAEMRARGLEPIPKLNFSTAHDTWLKEYRRLVSTPAYYRVAADLIREVCEVFDSPRLFHLGFDEETAIAQDQAGWEITIVRQGDLWWHDLFFLAGECEKNGARPWIWSDYYVNHPETFLERMPKSILQMNYFYREIVNVPESDWRYKWIESYRVLERHGFDQIGCPSTWDTNHCALSNLGFFKNELTSEHFLGVVTAPWEATTNRMLWSLYNDAHQLYLARKQYYPETL